MADRKKNRKWLIPVFAVVAALLIIWIAWGNSTLELNTYTVTGDRIPPAFSGFRIAQVSDLHNGQMGEHNRDLLSMLRDAQPDMIAITGDLIDSRRTNMDVALDFAREAVKIAPCYYVTGNHEGRVADYHKLRNGLTALGVTVLESTRVELVRNEETLVILGINDPMFHRDDLHHDGQAARKIKLKELVNAGDAYTVLLSHRPELLDIYAYAGADLVLTGHAHGGQFRLPFFGGLFAPNQGFFPEYDAGMYVRNSTTMIVSRGIGNSIFPFRINNRPEVVLIELNATP